jgi:hypothetical protein
MGAPPHFGVLKGWNKRLGRMEGAFADAGRRKNRCVCYITSKTEFIY